LSLVFGCFSWLKQVFEVDFDNIEYVSIMNDNWDFDSFWRKISVQKDIDTSEQHQSFAEA
jgi:hypothetical protein